MKRSQPLKADPQKVQEWQQRSRERAIERARGREGVRADEIRRATAPGDFRDADGALVGQPPAPIRPAAGTPLRRKRRKRKAKIPKGVRQEALARSGGLCVVCVHDLLLAGKRVGAAFRAVQLHHVLPEDTWPELAKLADNLVGVCPGDHDDHERANRRIPRAALPECSLRLARNEGLSWYIELTYPA